MKTQITKPVSGKTKYSEEYKQQAVERWQNSGRSAAKVGAELEIRPALLFRWAKALRDRKAGQAAGGARSLEPSRECQVVGACCPKRVIDQRGVGDVGSGEMARSEEIEASRRVLI